MKKLLTACTLSLTFIAASLKADTTSHHAKTGHKKEAVRKHKAHPHHKQDTHKPGEHHKATGTKHHTATKEKVVTTKHNGGFLSELLGGGTAVGATTDKVIGKTASGKTIYLGPRGGHYYINDHGNKEYLVQEK